MKVWESPFIPSHLTFKSFEFTHFQTINQTINQIYLFIITFQNLEFWDVTNLPPLKWISSLRFEKASKKEVRVWGSSQNPSIITGVWGATTLRNIVTVPSKLIYSILIVGSVNLLRFSGKFLLWALPVVA